MPVHLGKREAPYSVCGDGAPRIHQKVRKTGIGSPICCTGWRTSSSCVRPDAGRRLSAKRGGAVPASANEAQAPNRSDSFEWRLPIDCMPIDTLMRTGPSRPLAALPQGGKKQERARAKCLGALLPTHEGLGIAVAVIESRNDRKADPRDVEAAERLRRAGAISSIRVDHAGPEEHLLWLPDQVLGTYVTALCGTAEAASWADDWERVLPSIDVITVDL